MKDALLEKAIEARDKYIKSHPKMLKYQRDLNLALEQLEDPMDRLTVILKKISDNADEINDVLRKLSRDIHRQ